MLLMCYYGSIMATTAFNFYLKFIIVQDTGI